MFKSKIPDWLNLSGATPKLPRLLAVGNLPNPSGNNTLSRNPSGPFVATAVLSTSNTAAQHPSAPLMRCNGDVQLQPQPSSGAPVTSKGTVAAMASSITLPPGGGQPRAGVTGEPGRIGNSQITGNHPDDPGHWLDPLYPDSTSAQRLALISAGDVTPAAPTASQSSGPTEISSQKDGEHEAVTTKAVIPPSLDDGQIMNGPDAISPAVLLIADVVNAPPKAQMNGTSEVPLRSPVPLEVAARIASFLDNKSVLEASRVRNLKNEPGLKAARQTLRREALTKEFTKSANDVMEALAANHGVFDKVEGHFRKVKANLHAQSKDVPDDARDFAHIYIESFRVMVRGFAQNTGEYDRDSVREYLFHLLKWCRKCPSEYRANLGSALREGFEIANVPFPDLALVSDETKLSEAHLSAYLNDAFLSTYSFRPSRDGLGRYTSRNFYDLGWHKYPRICSPIEEFVGEIIALPRNAVGHAERLALLKKYFGLALEKIARREDAHTVGKIYEWLLRESRNPRVNQWRKELRKIPYSGPQATDSINP